MLSNLKMPENSYSCDIITVVLIVLAVIAIVVGVIFIQQAITENSYSICKTSCNGRNPLVEQSTHLPLKVNAAGVIPVIFAVSFIVTPQTIASFFPTNDVTLGLQTYLIIHIQLE